MTRLFNRAAIAGLGLALGLAFVASPAQATSTARWRLVYEPRLQGLLTSVTTTGPRDAWAVGALYHGQALVDQPFVIHWNGLGWHAGSLPHASGFVTQVVRASSPRNVWVFASFQRSAPFPPGVFRWDGSAWHSVPVPDSVGTGDPVVLSATDVWTAGGGNCAVTRGGLLNCKTLLWHWNGRTWRSFSVGTSVTGLAAASSRDVWAVGLNAMTQRGEVRGNVTAYRWNGTRWILVSMPHPRIDFDPGIGMSSATDVWLGAGITLPHSGGQQVGFAMHWNGRRWQQLTAPASLSDFGPVLPDGHGGVWLGPTAHWTGRSWVGVTVSVRSGISWSFEDMAKVPGTSSYWGPGLLSASSGSFRPVMFVYGAIPR
jgi:hypothetical protein